MSGNTITWIVLLAIAGAAVITVLAGLWVSRRRERRRGYDPAYRVRRPLPSRGPDSRD